MTDKLVFMEPEKSDRILRYPDVKKKIPVTNVTLWRWEREGEFPKRFRLGGNSAGWLESEVDQWIKDRAAAR